MEDSGRDPFGMTTSWSLFGGDELGGAGLDGSGLGGSTGLGGSIGLGGSNEGGFAAGVPAPSADVGFSAEACSNTRKILQCEFLNFCAIHAVSEVAIEILIKNGVNSLMAAKALLPGDLDSLSIPLGQRRILEQALDIQRPPESTVTKHPPPSTPVGHSRLLAYTNPFSPQAEAGAVARPRVEVAANPSSPAAEVITKPSSPLPGVVDAGGATGGLPHSNTCRLLGVSPTGEQPDYLKVVNFVSVLDSKEEDKISLPDGSYFVKKGSKSKPSVEAVSPLQYMEASAKIMATLISKGSLSPQGVRDYLAYMVMIAQLGQKYVWSSVMSFDDLYRKAQAIDGFPWGSDVSHARDVTLRPREFKSSPTDKDSKVNSGQSSSDRKSGSSGNKKPTQKSGTDKSGPDNFRICIAFNNGQPCPRNPCQYRHFCSTCGSGSHGRSGHSSAAGAAPAASN